MVGWASFTVIATPAMIPRKPKTRSRQVARLAASHQITRSRQHNSGPKTATIQYFVAPPSETLGPYRAATIRTANTRAGHALSGRNVLPEPGAGGSVMFSG